MTEEITDFFRRNKLLVIATGALTVAASIGGYFLHRKYRRESDLAEADKIVQDAEYEVDSEHKCEQLARAFALEEKWRDRDDVRLAILSNYIAGVESSVGRHRDAALHFERALVVFKTAGRDEEVPAVLTALGTARRRLHDSEAARAAFKEAVDAQTKTFGEKDEATLAAKRNLAQVSIDQKLPDEAIEIMSTVLAAQEEKYGGVDCHMLQWETLLVLAQALSIKREKARAREFGNRALALARKFNDQPCVRATEKMLKMA